MRISAVFLIVWSVEGNMQSVQRAGLFEIFERECERLDNYIPLEAPQFLRCRHSVVHCRLMEGKDRMVLVVHRPFWRKELFQSRDSRISVGVVVTMYRKGLWWLSEIGAKDVRRNSLGEVGSEIGGCAVVACSASAFVRLGLKLSLVDPTVSVFVRVGDYFLKFVNCF